MLGVLATLLITPQISFAIGDTEVIDSKTKAPLHAPIPRNCRIDRAKNVVVIGGPAPSSKTSPAPVWEKGSKVTAKFKFVDASGAKKTGHHGITLADCFGSYCPTPNSKPVEIPVRSIRLLSCKHSKVELP